MNIFTLDDCPKKSAELQHDKHVVKMILESAQMLCGVYHAQEIDGAPYRKTHHNHPCSVWAREDMDNFYWLINHAFALCKEYTHRYGRVHKSQAVIEWCRKNASKLNIPMVGITPFAQAMPNEYRQPNSIKAYRNYYVNEKLNRKTKWTNRNIPNIFINKMELINKVGV